ncbi:MAG: ATP-binding cassette domain-containing protein [Bacteroidetes bacterium]|nr:ATP-binding cassette domain-containing protein [Bacteroidota bacterium]
MAKRNQDTSKTDELVKAKLNWKNFKKSFRLFNYLKQQKYKFFLGMLFLVASAGIGLLFPMKSGSLLGMFGDDAGSVDDKISKLLSVGGLLLLILGVQGIISFLRVYFFAQVTENILQGLRNDTFSRLIQMPMGYFSKNQSAELSSRIATDINVISDAFTVNIAEIIRQSIVGIGGLALMVMKVDWFIAKWFVIIIPPLTLIAILFAKKIRKYSKDLQDKIAEANVIVAEALTGITNVKTYTSETKEINRFETKTSQIRTIGLKYGLFRGVFFTFVVTFIFGTVFFILFKMIEAKINGQITAEEFGEFMMLSLFVSASLGGLPEQIAGLQKALGATDRVFEIIDGEIEKINLSNQHQQKVHQPSKIEFENVSFNYPTRADFSVLKSVSFIANPGETVALVGSSGSGKSTIASLLLRFYDPNNGIIKINNTNTRNFDLTELRELIALVPQDVVLFAGSIKENIGYGKPNATDEEIIEAAKQANALDFINAFPDKFNTLVGERGIQLSGGQRQRLAIARAVLKNPSILILDEATSSLDSESEKLVQEALDKLMKGRTSIVIAHRLATIRNADRIVVIQKGEIKENGTHNDLMKLQDGFYQKLSKMQFELS